MKLRISGNSIRLRLLRSEVKTIGAGRPIEVQTALLPSPLAYRLETTAGALKPTVRFANNVVLVVIPWSLATAWASGDEVGIEATIDGAEGSTIRLLIEKDFRCLHGEEANGPDCYPNPRDAAEVDANEATL